MNFPSMGGTSPDLETDPRAISCECGAKHYPGELCPTAWMEWADADLLAMIAEARRDDDAE